MKEIKEIKLEEFTNAAMQIILYAGDARTFSEEAVAAAKAGDFVTSDAKMKEANEKIVEAHKHQTDILQAEMRYEGTGKCSQVPLLFIHAQDTIMTIMTEVNLRKEMIELLRTKKEN
jgi:PTS system cellobiose-specific IIA component